MTSMLSFEESENWHESLKHVIRDPRELLQRLSLWERLKSRVDEKSNIFPLFVTESYFNRIQPNDPNDPLLRQILPLLIEDQAVSELSTDPLKEEESRVAPGLLQKYAGRALLIITGSCAIHCRYCFRRSYPYQSEPQKLSDWDRTFEQIAQDDSLSEIILSGGDPLILKDDRFFFFLDRLEAISHVKRCRIHSRIPIVLPNRMTDSFINRLCQSRLTPLLVVHANHAQELQNDCAETLQKLARSGLTLLNQAVLLKGVNDTFQAQKTLCEQLVNLGVLPYYLHQLDRVRGTIHFEVPVELGISLINQLRKELPGYAVPRYVQEVPGEPHKVVIR